MSFYAIYASDVTNGRSLTLSNTNDLATQVYFNSSTFKFFINSVCLDDEKYP